MALNFYSPEDVIVTIGGVLKLSGYVDGTFLECTKDIQPFASKRTPDGTTARLHVKDRNYTIRFTLAQSSESNDLLMKIQQIDEITKMGYFPLLIKDSRGSSILFAPTAWIEMLPSLSFSNGIEGRTWELRATGCVTHIGGNEGSDDLYQDLIKTILSSAPTLADVIGDLTI